MWNRKWNRLQVARIFFGVIPFLQIRNWLIIGLNTTARIKSLLVHHINIHKKDIQQLAISFLRQEKINKGVIHSETNECLLYVRYNIIRKSIVKFLLTCWKQVLQFDLCLIIWVHDVTWTWVFSLTHFIIIYIYVAHTIKWQIRI